MEHVPLTSHDRASIISHVWKKKLLWFFSFLLVLLIVSLLQGYYKQTFYRNLCTQTIIPINSEDAEIAVTEIINDPARLSVRIAYTKRDKGDLSSHWITCYFSDVYNKEDYELKSIETDKGFLSPTQVFFLNRFILFPISEEEMKQKTEF